VPGAPTLGGICCTCARYGERVLKVNGSQGENSWFDLILGGGAYLNEISNHLYVPGFLFLEKGEDSPKVY
jgi:hypothetical protein